MMSKLSHGKGILELCAKCQPETFACLLALKTQNSKESRGCIYNFQPAGTSDSLAFHQDVKLRTYFRFTRHQAQICYDLRKY